jgi:hypothetical protein
MLRLFTIWNRGYKPLLVIAHGGEDALVIAERAKHIKRLHNYRRLLDSTEEYLSQDDGSLAKLLAGEVTGVASLVDGVWHVDGKPAPV